MRVVWSPTSFVARSHHRRSGGVETPPSPGQRAELPAAARLFVALVVAAGLASAVAFAPHSIPDVPLFLTLLLASTLTSGITLRLPVGTANLSVAYIFDLTALLVFGRELAVLVAAASAFSQSILSERPQPLHRTIFNTATLALSMAAAGTVFMALGGLPG